MIKRVIFARTLRRPEPAASAARASPATTIVASTLKATATAALSIPARAIAAPWFAVRLTPGPVVAATRHVISASAPRTFTVLATATGTSSLAGITPRFGFHAGSFG